MCCGYAIGLSGHNKQKPTRTSLIFYVQCTVNNRVRLFAPLLGRRGILSRTAHEYLIKNKIVHLDFIAKRRGCWGGCNNSLNKEMV